MHLFKYDNQIYETVEQACQGQSIRPHILQDILDNYPSKRTYYLTEEESANYRQTLSVMKSTDDINSAICSLYPAFGRYHTINGNVVVGNGVNWINITTGLIVLEDDDMQQRFDVTYKTANVNSKRLLHELVTLMENISNEFITRNRSTSQAKYQYDGITEFMEAYFEELQKDNIITVYDVIADFRNNNTADVQKGMIKVDLCFKQFNCLNTTKINFTLKAKK